MPRPIVKLKDPGFSALLAFLLPGLGHFYQRRVFKGILYSVCILGTFFTGLRIGHGQVVYFQWKPADNRTYAYLCQFWVGLPALPALAQAKLRSKDALEANYVSRPFSSKFEGTLSEAGLGENKIIGKVKGTIEISPRQPDTPRYWKAKIKGKLTTSDGAVHDIEGALDRGFLEAEVAPWPERLIKGERGEFVGRIDQNPEETYLLKGSIPRSFWNTFEAPLQDTRSNEITGESSDLDRAHKELGGRFELGVVYTMIAGLLNILAIYDAYEGPAYEQEEEDEQSDKPNPNPPPAT